MPLALYQCIQRVIANSHRQTRLTSTVELCRVGAGVNWLLGRFLAVINLPTYLLTCRHVVAGGLVYSSRVDWPIINLNAFLQELGGGRHAPTQQLQPYRGNQG